MRVGTDIVMISRIPVTKESFIKGVLSPKERAIFDSRNDKAEFLAGRYAAKEAFLKAVGTGLSGARLNEIEVLYDEKGAPVLTYEGHEYSVSISHDGGYAISVVLA
ncbi:MAG: holo-ACP synthase [Bacilli bacterium]|jgi:phosphopantetheine--protein transferase-like protein|nr:holo-ACP synthase [Bacilli bacterium]MCH4210316.1 holo-ACP synthase [Bacilli bacterium]MCH4228963.1 holo-ACP synthase [Bacilli bacterium]MCH4278408.1 holo-ACP synthase [Bacilli bacterium]MCI2054806.1 holo-ACP synthase [Bacilli bacterium]